MPPVQLAYDVALLPLQQWVLLILASSAAVAVGIIVAMRSHRRESSDDS